MTFFSVLQMQEKKCVNFVIDKFIAHHKIKEELTKLQTYSHNFLINTQSKKYAELGNYSTFNQRKKYYHLIIRQRNAILDPIYIYTYIY